MRKVGWVADFSTVLLVRLRALPAFKFCLTVTVYTGRVTVLFDTLNTQAVEHNHDLMCLVTPLLRVSSSFLPLDVNHCCIFLHSLFEL